MKLILMLVLVNSAGNIVDFVDVTGTFGGLNPDYTVYKCEVTGKEKTLAELPEGKVDVTDKIAVKKGSEIEGVSTKAQLEQRKLKTQE